MISTFDKLIAQRAILAARQGDAVRLNCIIRERPRFVTQQLREHVPASSFWLTVPGVGRWGAADWQRRCLTDPSLRCLIRGGNKIGKSTALALKVKRFVTGEDVHQRPSGSAKILYIVADMANAYADDVCRTLREFITDEDLSRDTKYTPTRGFTTAGKRAIVFANGDEVMFRSGTQDGQAIAGLWADLVLVNEPPMRERWGEIMRAAALKNAPVLVGFTPVDNHGVSRDVTWLREIVEADGSSWSQHVVVLSPENAPHRRPEDVAQQIADMPPWEVAQRRDAEWEGPAPERTLSAFGPQNVFTARPGEWDALPDVPEGEELRIGIAADHGEKANKEVVILYAYCGKGEDLRCWVLDCYVSPGVTGIGQDAEGVIQMLTRWGLTPDHCDEAIGDTNSSGKGDMTSRTVNEAFSNAFKALGYSLRMKPADKGAGSVGLGVRVLNDAFARMRLWICTQAAEIRRAAERWNGKNDNHKDKVDPLRYGPGALFKAWRESSRSRHVPAVAPVETDWFGGGSMWEGEF